MSSSTKKEKDPGTMGESHELENPDLEQKPTVDAVRADEGLKILATYTGDREWTPEEEKKLVRKIDLRLLTLLTLSYGLQYYDKALLGQAVSNRVPFFFESLLFGTLTNPHGIGNLWFSRGRGPGHR